MEKMTENTKLFVAGFDKKTRDHEIFEFLNRWGDIK